MKLYALVTMTFPTDDDEPDEMPQLGCAGLYETEALAEEAALDWDEENYGTFAVKEVELDDIFAARVMAEYE